MVKKTGKGSFLRVTTMRREPKQHRKLVLLPTETFETASRWALVSC